MPTADEEVSANAQRARLPRLNAGTFGTALLLCIALPCFLSLPWTLGLPPNSETGQWYNDLRTDKMSREQPPGWVEYVRSDTAEGEASEDAEAQEPAADDAEAQEGDGAEEGGGADEAAEPGTEPDTQSPDAEAATQPDADAETESESETDTESEADTQTEPQAVADASDDEAAPAPDKGPVYKSFEPMGTDVQGRSLFARCLLGGAISLGVGICAALMAVFIGVTWGAMAGYIGGRTDAIMMRIVDVLYGLPYLLLVVLLSVAVNGVISRFEGVAAQRMKDDPTYEPGFLISLIQDNTLIVNLLVLVIAIGGVSWLTMARVIRGQVLSLRTLPFIEAARAQGMGPWRILRVHLLPNLIGPIVVYTTLAVPQAILQESFLSFLGIGVGEPLPSWGKLASIGIKELPSLALPALEGQFKWWLIVFPCVLLGLTLLSLNFMGDALRERFDPRSKQRT